MQVENNTPFAVIAWDNTDSARHWYISCLTKVKYRLRQMANGQWALRLCPQQSEFVGGDTFYHDDINRALRYESDFVCYKPNTDIVLNAATYSPNSQPSSQWSCGVTVLSPLGEPLVASHLKVQGARTWTHTPLGWAKTAMEPATRVALNYESAEGGCIYDPAVAEDEVPEILTTYPDNPVGSGIKHRKMSRDDHSVAQVEWAKASMAFKRYPPGFGFINRTWPIRLAYAGTYDEQWQAEQHPFLPHDYDHYHQQGANPELILNGYIPLKSEFVLHNLLPKHGEVRFHLPELHCIVDVTDHDGRFLRHQMNIDTVLLDIESEQSDDWAVYVSYRHYQRQSQHGEQDNPMRAVSFHYLPSELMAQSAAKQNKEVSNG